MNLIDIEPGDSSKYRLIGNNVLSYRFAVPHNEEIYIGDVLKITDRKKAITFFAKVNDLVHESNFADNKWDTRPHTEQFYGLGEDVYLIAEASPLGYVDESGRFSRPKTVPTKFSPVSVPDAVDFAFLKDVMGDIEVGMMKTGTGVIEGAAVCLHSQVLSQHMGVFATTGMGKSNFMKVFCASCMKERQFGLLLIDPHGEYVAGAPSPRGGPVAGLIDFTDARDGLTVFTTDGKKRKKFVLNALYLDFDDFRTTDLLLLYDHSQAQREAVEILEDFQGSEVIDFFQDTDFAGFDADLYNGPYPVIARSLKNFHPGTLSVIQRRITGLMRRNRAFFRKKGSSINDIIRSLHDNRVVLIDIPGMGEQSELFVLSIITRRILRDHQETGVPETAETPVMQKQVLITIEEAQRVLGAGGGSTQIFRECAMEGRKFGVGLCVITQQPKNIDARILAQVNTFVVMGLADRNDRTTVETSAKQDLSRMDVEIQTLDVGEAIISSLGIPFPVSTRIHRFEDYLAALNDAGDGRTPGKESLSMKF